MKGDYPAKPNNSMITMQMSVPYMNIRIIGQAYVYY